MVPDRAVEPQGGLLVRHAAEVAEHDRRTIALRQPFDLVVEHGQEFQEFRIRILRKSRQGVIAIGQERPVERGLPARTANRRLTP